MSRLPPPSATSLPATFFSVLLHGAAVVAGIIAVPHMAQPEPVASQMLYIPLELVTIDETTNMTAVVQQAEEMEVTEAASEIEATPPPATPPPDEDTVSLEKPVEKPKDPPKPEAKPTPPKPSKDLNSEIDDILAGVTKSDTRKQRNDAAVAPGGAPEAPRMSAGDKRRMTATIQDAIKSQLISKGCWADHSDMADAKRLRATMRVWFGRNGKFSQKYQLVDPAREPFNDPPLQAFIAHARRALDKCNNLGWEVPEQYFLLPQPQYIDLEFLPKIGAAQ